MERFYDFVDDIKYEDNIKYEDEPKNKDILKNKDKTTLPEKIVDDSLT